MSGSKNADKHKLLLLLKNMWPGRSALYCCYPKFSRISLLERKLIVKKLQAKLEVLLLM